MSLVDAAAGEEVVLVHHRHHDVASPAAVAYLHVHNARPGCFAARIDRRTAH